MEQDYFMNAGIPMPWSSDQSLLWNDAFSLREGGPTSQINPATFLHGSATNSNEESSVSDQIPSINSRKRKASISRSNPHKKPTENEEECNDKNKTPLEPPKDYIHVRARRGQATDSHSLAERVRREKISVRMKLLQDLVPGCNKVTGKALMLDEIINYVQSLQRQVEFLSMKLASLNPALDFNLLSKDMFQQNTTLPQQMHPPLHSSAPAFHHQNVQHQQLCSTNISAQCSLDPLPFHGFNQNIPQFSDDLHTIVGMGFLQNSVQNEKLEHES